MKTDKKLYSVLAILSIALLSSNAYAKGGSGGWSGGGSSSSSSSSPSSSSSSDDNSVRHSWADDMVNGVKLRGDGSVDDNLPRHSGLDDSVNGVKLRGDGSVDDNLPRHSWADDMVNGVKLRGDGSVDDNLPRHSGLDDSVNGVKLRGDWSVDDNSSSSSNRRWRDSLSERERNQAENLISRLTSKNISVVLERVLKTEDRVMNSSLVPTKKQRFLDKLLHLEDLLRARMDDLSLN
ncbi:MAG: hypothetical protein ACD_3C00067G0009 [uncultured bacterium (gcode 4)]|uniref:Uncharacterized protein n=1 Tax=uncultured bacterium (gcode 4) TaxID=1234023 RepID=K2GY21_9BACT|nr:MAG: hypothetical protein ACD_3C00067G0009 [uncultured bacterium (gcode 4)]